MVFFSRYLKKNYKLQAFIFLNLRAKNNFNLLVTNSETINQLGILLYNATG